MSEIKSVSECQMLLDRDYATFLKHSAHCGLSREAYRLIVNFCAENSFRVHVILVNESRIISNFMERESGVRHESPQVIAMYNGQVFAHASHRGITAEFLKKVKECRIAKFTGTGNTV